MEHAIKTAISNAFSTLDYKAYETREQLLDDLFNRLFPHNTDVKPLENVEIPVAAPAPAAEPEKKARAKPGPKPKEATGPVHLEKLTPTQWKKMKAIAEELTCPEPDKKQFLSWVNALSKETYDAHKLEDHMRNFLKPADAPAVEQPVAADAAPAAPAEPAVEKKTRGRKPKAVAPPPAPEPEEKKEEPLVESEGWDIEWQGKTYFVEKESRKVFLDEVKVGYVDMGMFAGMGEKVPKDE